MRELLVADSFRVRLNPKTGAPEVRGLSQHLDRFRTAGREAWCGPHRPSAEERRLAAAARRALLSERRVPSKSVLVFRPPIWSPHEQQLITEIEHFLHDARAQIADYGEGWPRLELLRDGHSPEPKLELKLRPLPELSDTIELRTAGQIKTEHPARKGPNVARYAELNHELGAEALLLDKRGNVLEGTTTSLVWWPSEPDGPEPYGGIVASDRRVRSVTEALLVEAGGGRLVGTKPNRKRIGQPQPRSASPGQLAGHGQVVRLEVWAVNALHGIRVVTAIDGVSMPKPNEPRLQWFRDALDRTWQPVRAEMDQG